eukprot:TRINITY_DN4729_c0_g1_i2.p3 TRINITY_DN4729_c0_g1~~TRINITY_DN4729_c0_g1_i2.p3  ORF type:complete len:142 (-),score=41.46 TRINITY_DN4729_c0_g1_i2:210-635(-)
MWLYGRPSLRRTLQKQDEALHHPQPSQFESFKPNRLTLRERVEAAELHRAARVAAGELERCEVMKGAAPEMTHTWENYDLKAHVNSAQAHRREAPAQEVWHGVCVIDQFEEMDRNEDGVVDREEWELYHKQCQHDGKSLNF